MPAVTTSWPTLFRTEGCWKAARLARSTRLSILAAEGLVTLGPLGSGRNGASSCIKSCLSGRLGGAAHDSQRAAIESLATLGLRPDLPPRRGKWIWGFPAEARIPM